MKRFVFTIIFLLQLVSPLKATPNKQDSLRVFLEQIGEDTTMISLIVNSPDAKEPRRIIDNYNKKESIADWQGKLQYFEMIKFILLQKKLVCYFDEDVNKKLNNIVAESNDTSPYYSQFKAYLNSLSDLELARITEEQTATIVKTLLVGVAEGEKMSQMTYAFMLLTGQFVEKDEVLGHKILNDLLE